MFPTGFTLFNVLFFFFNESPSSSLKTVFEVISSNADKVSQSTHLLEYLSFETLMLFVRIG